MDGTQTNIDSIESWMKDYLADLLDIPVSDVSADQPFERMGLDSAASVAFTSDLGSWLGVALDSDMMVDQDNINAVAAFIRKTHTAA